MTPNTGTRPSHLKDTDKVNVKLRNGLIKGPWQVRSNASHAIRWTMTGHQFDIVEWEKA